MRRIGVLMSRAESDTEGRRYAAAFLQGLAALGWVPDQNVKIEYRWQGGDANQAQAFARELVELRPDVLVANATPSLAAMRQATRTIPIVFIGVADPVGQGFVPSLARPGGNMTGFGLEEPSMGAKWVELLKEISPRMARAAILFNPETAPFGRMFLPSMHAGKQYDRDRAGDRGGWTRTGRRLDCLARCLLVRSARDDRSCSERAR